MHKKTTENPPKKSYYVIPTPGSMLLPKHACVFVVLFCVSKPFIPVGCVFSGSMLLFYLVFTTFPLHLLILISLSCPSLRVYCP